MFIPELPGLKYTHKSSLPVKLYAIYLLQVMPKTYLEFFWHLALEALTTLVNTFRNEDIWF